jgi:hypothetical protein
MKCPFNNCNNNQDIPQFSTAIEHLIISLDHTGHAHVHGPFDNQYAMKRLADAMIMEMHKHGVEYTPPEIKDKI